MTGRVHLVGAGPGDPMLLTRRAARLLAEADVVVSDRPSLAGIVALAPAGAERVLVGRADGQTAWGTEAVVELLVGRARLGRTVVRLKSGDPFVCSRGAEELVLLRAQGIDVDVTPGVTAATAAPLVASAPLGRTVTIASGDDDPLAALVPWADLADPLGSIVVLTGRAHQGPIADALVAGGLPAHAPVRLVHAATRPEQRVLACRLDELGGVRLPPPAAFVVGPVGGARAHP